MARPKGPPFTVPRYGSLGASIIAERDWLKADLETKVTARNKWMREAVERSAEITQLRGTLSLAEEGLANYAQENGHFRKALEMIRDGSIPQAMSPALFAEFVLRGPVPQPREHET